MSQEIITQLDAYLFGDYASGTPALQAYWENIFEQETDGLASLSDSALTHYHAFARMGLSSAAGSMKGHPNDNSCRYAQRCAADASLWTTLSVLYICLFVSTINIIIMQECDKPGVKELHHSRANGYNQVCQAFFLLDCCIYFQQFQNQISAVGVCCHLTFMTCHWFVVGPVVLRALWTSFNCIKPCLVLYKVQSNCKDPIAIH